MIIAELGLNAYPFTPEHLREMCNAARQSGADAVKVQFFRAEHFPASERALKSIYEFPAPVFAEFASIAHEYSLLAGASIFEPRHVIGAANCGIDFIKIAAREWQNDALIRACEALDWMTVYQSWPIEFRHQAVKPRALEWYLMLCISQYPTPIRNAMNRAYAITPPFKGWSSHTAYISDCIEAVEHGAIVVEKHLALSKNDPEAAWSLLPPAFEFMCHEIKALNE